jgi:hypothetical protein
MHGGTTPSGPAHHNWKHGRYWKFLPAGLLSRARELAEDPDLLSLTSNLVAIDVHIAEVYEQLAEPARAEAWGKVHALVGCMEQALHDNSTAAMMQAFLELREVSRTGASTLALGDQLMRLHETRRRLVRTEAARQQGEHASISIDRAVGVMVLLVEVMFRHVRDPKVRRRIIGDVRALELAPDIAAKLDSGDAPSLQLVPRSAEPDEPEG